MITKRSKFILASAVVLVAFTSVIPRGVYQIKSISLVREAEAQRGGGIMQNIMPILMLMMLMNMMQQNKGNQLQREQANAARNANANLMKAGNQPNGGSFPPGIANPGVNPGINPGINAGINPGTNPGNNPFTNPNTNPFGIFNPR